MNVVFEEEQEFVNKSRINTLRSSHGSGLTEYLMRSFPQLFPTRKRTEITLLIFTLIAFAITVVVAVNLFIPEKPTPIPPSVQRVR